MSYVTGHVTSKARNFFKKDSDKDSGQLTVL